MTVLENYHYDLGDAVKSITFFITGVGKWITLPQKTFHSRRPVRVILPIKKQKGGDFFLSYSFFHPKELSFKRFFI